MSHPQPWWTRAPVPHLLPIGRTRALSVGGRRRSTTVRHPDQRQLLPGAGHGEGASERAPTLGRSVPQD